MEPMTDCHDRDMALSAWVDGELGRAEKLRVEAHLASCPRCRIEAARFERLSVMIREADAEETADHPMPSLWPAISRGIAEEDAPSARSLVHRWRAWAPAWARPVWVPLAIAAVLALTIALPLFRHVANLQADDAIVESVDEGEVMVFPGKKSTIIIVRDK
jgi:anti-sigma factor RsiW